MLTSSDFLTASVLAKFVDIVEAGGFGFVSAFLREKCANGSLKCYATRPRFAARREEGL